MGSTVLSKSPLVKEGDAVSSRSSGVGPCTRMRTCRQQVAQRPPEGLHRCRPRRRPACHAFLAEPSLTALKVRHCTALSDATSHLFYTVRDSTNSSNAQRGSSRLISAGLPVCLSGSCNCCHMQSDSPSSRAFPCCVCRGLANAATLPTPGLAAGLAVNSTVFLLGDTRAAGWPYACWRAPLMGAGYHCVFCLWGTRVPARVPSTSSSALR